MLTGTDSKAVEEFLADQGRGCEGIYQRKQYSQRVANRVGPGQLTALFAADEDNHERDDRKARHDQTGGDQPVGERLPIDEISGPLMRDANLHRYRSQSLFESLFAELRTVAFRRSILLSLNELVFNRQVAPNRYLFPI
jgi:hypothetical protein